MPNAIEWETPRYSQHRDVRNRRWKNRACGAVAFKMMCDHHRPDADISLPRIIARVASRGGYLRNVGWRHKELADAASLYGLRGKNFDWAHEPYPAARANLKALLRAGPTVLSVWRNPEKRSGGHLVTAVGFNASSVVIHDPDGRTPQEIRKRVPWPAFRMLWKQRAIAVRPERIAKRK